MILGVFLAILTIFIAIKINSSKKTLIHLTVIPLFAGLIFQYKRISQKWSSVISTALTSFALSFLCFLPGKHEHNYDLEDHIQTWPFYFLAMFIIMAIAFHQKEITEKITEGINFLQSLAIIYWVLDQGFMNSHYVIVKMLMAIGLLFASFSFFNAFTNFALSKTVRLTLSIWSCLIMVLFAVDNIYQVSQAGEIETANALSIGLYIALQYFLLGVSSIYMANNFLLLLDFLPGKGTFFNEQYFKDLESLKIKHIERFSTQQVTFFDSLVCLLLVGTVFGLNYYYNFVPRNFIIWSVFVIFPFILNIYYKLKKR